jgi:hypothetical protein
LNVRRFLILFCLLALSTSNVAAQAPTQPVPNTPDAPTRAGAVCGGAFPGSADAASNVMAVSAERTDYYLEILPENVSVVGLTVPFTITLSSSLPVPIYIPFIRK